MDWAIVAFKEGGAVMYFLLLGGFIMIGISIERFIVLWLQFPPKGKDFMTRFLSFLNQGRLDLAQKLCKEKNNPLSRILLVAIKAYGKDPRQMQNAVDEISLGEIPKLQERTSFLAMISQIATLLGLLGTIVGLIESFSAVASADAAHKSFLLASGISKAMYATAFGLTIAIPAMVLYTVIIRKTEKSIDILDECTVKAMNILQEKVKENMVEEKISV